MVKKLFAGGNTPLGFYSYFYDILDKRREGKLYILKGGSGVGKGTFIRLFATELEKLGENVTYYYCSGDSESLDGACCERLNIAIIDGTAPHIIDPTLPGITDEIVNLGVYLCHDKLLPHKAEIERGINYKAEQYKLAYELLSAAENLDNVEKYFYNLAIKESAVSLVAEHITAKLLENPKISERKNVKRETIESQDVPFIEKEIKTSDSREFPTEKNVEKVNAEGGAEKNVKSLHYGGGRLKHRFGKAYTPEGVVSFGDFEKNTYKVTELVADSDNEIHAVLSVVAKSLVGYGFDVEVYHNPMRPLEVLAIYVPETGDYFCRYDEPVFADYVFESLSVFSEYGDKNFTLSDKMLLPKNASLNKKTTAKDCSLVDIRAVTSGETIRRGKDILSDTAKEKEKLIALAVECMLCAKELHKEIEKFYIAAMDWNELEAFRKDFIEKELKKLNA